MEYMWEYTWSTRGTSSSIILMLVLIALVKRTFNGISHNFWMYLKTIYFGRKATMWHELLLASLHLFHNG